MFTAVPPSNELEGACNVQLKLSILPLQALRMIGQVHELPL
jgi:hypothetical protein